MTKEILRLAEQLYVANTSLQHIGPLRHDAEMAIKAAEVFYQIKGEIETGVVK